MQEIDEQEAISLASFVEQERNLHHHNEDINEGESLLENPSKGPKIEIEEKRPIMKDFLLVAWVTFLGEMSRGVVVPVLWPYLQTLHGNLQFLGLVSSAFSFSRFFAAPFFGWWSGFRGHKEVMLICLVFLTVGNILYALYPPPWLLLISRIIVGLGAGTLGQSRGYASQVSTKAQRTRFMAYLTVSQFAGFAVTPGITSLLSKVDFDLFGVDQLEADEFSSGGYLMAGLSIITFVLVAGFFNEPPKPTSAPSKPPVEVSTKKRRASYYTQQVRQYTSSMFKHPEAKTIFLFALLTFTTRTAIAVVETSSSQISQNAFAWDSQRLSYCLCAMGVVGTVILIALPYVCERTGKLGEGVLLSVGILSLGLGMILMAPPSVVSFIAGLTFTWALGASLSQTLIITFLSRVLAPDSQGAVMGWLASLGSLSRIVGALWAGLALGTSGGAYLALGLPAALMIPCLLGTSFMVYKVWKFSADRRL